MRGRWNYKARGFVCAVLCLNLLFILTACTKQTADLPDMSAFGQVVAIAREDGSGTRSEFEALTGTSGGGIDQIAMSTQEVLEQVAANRDAVGYVALSTLSGGENVKILSVDGVSAEESTIKSGKYPLCRNYYVAYMGELNELETDFMTYLLSAGQKLVSQTCIPARTPSSFLSNGSAGTVTVCGSSSVAPLMEQLAEDYRSYNPNAVIQVVTSDSTSGLTAAIRGECDFAMSSRSLKDYESELLESKTIASDGVAVVVNSSNPLEGLTMEQLKKLYNGDFAMWADLK